MISSHDKDMTQSAKTLLARWMVRLSRLMLKASGRLDEKVAEEEQELLLTRIAEGTLNHIQAESLAFSKAESTKSLKASRSFVMTLDACEKLVKLTQSAAAHQGPHEDFLFHFLALYRIITQALQSLTELCDNAWSRKEVGDQIYNLFIQLSAMLPHDLGILTARQTMLEHLEPEEQFLVPILNKNAPPPMNTWTYQNEVMQWDLKPDQLVLDIGSGGWPFNKANHLADMFTGETTHRAETLRRDNRPFFCLDIQRMPFKDKTWDFIFCSHVLEHLENPGAAIRELSRVSNRGYIEVPTRLSDVMLNFTRLKDHHRWHGIVLDQTLILMEWRDGERRDMGSNSFFHALQSGYENEFRTFFERNWDVFYAMLHWEGEISFLVIDKHGRVIDQSGKGGVS